jgi:hypothetical protein
MFNLIITMMSIVLMGMMSMAALSYAGVIFSEKGSQNAARAQAVTLLTNAQQVAGAQRAYSARNSGNLANTYEVLIESGFLRAVPQLPVDAVIGGWTMSTDGMISQIPLNLDRVGQTGSSAERICELVPGFGGQTNISASGPVPSVSDLDGERGWFGCVVDKDATSVEDATQVWFVHRN